MLLRHIRKVTYNEETKALGEFETCHARSSHRVWTRATARLHDRLIRSLHQQPWVRGWHGLDKGVLA